MGNNSTKEARPRSRNESTARVPENNPSPSDTTDARLTLNGSRPHRNRNDGSFLGFAGGSNPTGPEPRRETKQERDVRRAKKEHAARVRERERSLIEEGVDGGYLVTLGTYTGTEDFSKPTVRQLMLERRLAPFWRGLNDHSDSWTEYQLVAAARGMPIPALDTIPPELFSRSVKEPQASESTKPIPIRSSAAEQSPAANSLPGSSNVAAASGASATSPLFRGRSKTLASLNLKTNAEPEPTSQEIQLPHEPQINGQPVEAQLYKDVMECPICFLYYPPHLNRTRCCDQAICSECFVQIKRPDPHPPEHLDPNSPVPEDIRRQEEEGQLISEPACCPFCVQGELGITYEPPPFRRGLAYANMPLSKSSSGYASSPASVTNGPGLTSGRRRGQSVSASAPGVITTDKVRPDWAQKLSDARGQASRRSAAATALHSAAYMMDGPQSRLGFGRRRRHFTLDPEGNDGEGSNRAHDGISASNMDLLMAALGDPGSSRGGRSGSGDPSLQRFRPRHNHSDEIEELMMMEAIRQSLAAEEDRKKKEDKEAGKKAKKEEKQKAKEQKAADKASDKAARKNGPYTSSNNGSSMWSSPVSSGTSPTSIEAGKGKGKAQSNESPSNAAMLSFNPISEPTSTLNAETLEESSSHSPQEHLEHSRSVLDPASHVRQSSGASSSSSSSFHESPREASSRTVPDSSLNFQSLAAMIGNKSTDGTRLLNPSSEQRDRASSQESTGSELPDQGVDQIETVTPTRENHAPIMNGRYDRKAYEDMNVLDQSRNGQITQ